MTVTQSFYLRAEEAPKLPEGWTYLSTEEASVQLKPGKLFDKKTASEIGRVPVLSQGASDYIGFHDEPPGVEASAAEPVLTFANHTCAMRLMTMPFSCIQNIFPKVGRPGVADTRYLYYASQGRVLLTDYKGHHPLFRQALVPIPPLPTQQRIASILGAYDDLIEVNRRRVAVLEEMAQGLFESAVRRLWSGSDDCTQISSIVSATLGGDWGTEQPDDENTVAVRIIRGTDIPRLGAGDYSSCPTRYIKASSAKKRLLEPTDVVLENSINAKTRSAGTTLLVTPGLLDELGGRVIAASFCRVFKFGNPASATAFHWWCRYLHATKAIERFQVVATNGIANFQTKQFLRDCILPFSISGDEAFWSLLASLEPTVHTLQLAYLAASRDLLLPRLISGQLSVDAAQRELGEAA